MKLTLNYNPHIQSPVSGAFIRGNHPTQWLTELNYWGVPLHELKAFVVPESFQNPAPAGLFVVFLTQKTPPETTILCPYRLVAGKLFLPLHTDLYPAVSEAELTDLLLWDYQVFHPTLGFIGFEKNDQVLWADLFTVAPPRTRQWTYAQPGNLPAPHLHRIRIHQPPVAELMQSFKESVGSKPLEEIPVTDTKLDPSEKNNLWTNLLLGILGLLMLLVSWLMIPFGWLLSLLPAGAGSSGSGWRGRSGSGSSTPGFLTRINNWLEKKRENLDKERDSELRRLLKLFDNNLEEALKYAIPLASPYAGRGEAPPPSSQLSRRDTNFTLRGLGGGGQVDGWNVDKYYYDLMMKYQQAANKETQAGNFRKAAYIYAQLLGNYQAAANVLEQGKFYREAAILYKDHLNDSPAAAECLERGGLWQESAELYLDLHKHEKAADLYQKLCQNEKAIQLYQHCVDDALAKNDHLDAARILTHKLDDTPKAKQTLLNGWSESEQAEICLNQYFDLVASTQPADLSQQIQEVYAQKTPVVQQTPFLQVLTTVVQKHREEKVAAVSQDIAYAIISEQLSKGNSQNLNRLKAFVPSDRLLATDCHRFLNQYKKPVSIPTVSSARTNDPVQVIPLPKDVNWLGFCTYREQIVGIGIDAQRTLHLIRSDWKGQKEIRKRNTSTPISSVTMVEDMVYSSHILVHMQPTTYELHENFPKVAAFDSAFALVHPRCFPEKIQGFALNSKGGITTLSSETDIFILSTFSLTGHLQQKHVCQFQDGRTFTGYTSDYPQKMISRNGYYYLFEHEHLIRISEKGEVQTLPLEAPIQALTTTGHHTALRLIVATVNGYFIVRPNAEEMLITHTFQESEEIVALQYVPDNGLVVATYNQAVVYDIKNDTPTVRSIIETQASIVQILPGHERHTCALITDDNQIAVYAIG